MAEIEADDILERTVGGKRRKVEQGQKWIGLNRPPYGYKTVGRGREVSLLIDEETAQVVRDIFRWYVEGEDASGPLSTLRIAEKLTALGIPTPQDLIPSRSHMKKRGYAQWSRASVHKILRQSA